MKNKNIGFIGGGRIVRIFLEGWRRKNIGLDRVVVYDCNEEALKTLRNIFPEIKTVKTPGELGKPDILFLAIHPPVVMETLEKIAPLITGKSILISLAPKIAISQMKGKLGEFDRIARSNPSAASIINRGYNPICFSKGLNEDDKALVMELLGALGNCPEVEEIKLEAYAVISAMGPTYFWFQWDELARLGVSFGLGKEETRNVLKDMIPAAMDLFLQYGTDAYSLIPARPLKDDEETIKNMLKTRLEGVYGKLKN
jgi:pyrroline-5-carboxylate reductase